MATKRAKTCNGKEEECNSDSTVAVDRISKLPDPIICHILSLVPTVYAVRMSILSRRWRRMWYSVPTLDFSDSVGFHKRESFDVFIEKCLMHRSRAMRYIADSVVTSLKLHIHYSPDIFAVNWWLESPVIQNNIKELDIYGDNTSTDDYNYHEHMPSVALSGRSLSFVKLDNLMLDGSCSVNLPSLKTLYLVDVTFENDVNDMLQNLMTGCPSLEKFFFCDCNTLDTEIAISSSSLKFLDIMTECEAVEVDALNLQSLTVYDYGNGPRISFSSCRVIKDLSLFGLCNGTDQNIGDQISKLTGLENLTLTLCDEFEHINITSPTLKHFYLLKRYKQELKVTTETPNLVSFKYDGDIGFSIAMGSPNPQLSGSFLMGTAKQRDTDWYTKLITFLSNINCSWNSLSLRFYGDKPLIVPENLRKTCCPPWPNLKHLKVTIIGDLTSEAELRKALEWLSPSLETLSIKKG